MQEERLLMLIRNTKKMVFQRMYVKMQRLQSKKRQMLSIRKLMRLLQLKRKR
jgi:hypothetical protein